MSSVLESAASDRYMVVARRYRPQSFDSLLGQDAIVRTLTNAIETNRVGHAYLFTGSRGVGKTSGARIFAKALNCERGPTTEACNACDSCIAVSTGEDIDVLEIDGASNRGIDEIRQLRANVGIRPSRSRYKIYIIDEVHMLSRDAFNALLKTLEEPPGHVKFIFCTTDVEKVPITVLSRCQRFDFSPISLRQIIERLGEIVASEGVQADADALELLARRAEGSLRDSQSLLEQVLSSAGGRITLDTVHQLLGTARRERVSEVVQALIAGDTPGALKGLDAAIQEGVDVGQFCEQLLTSIRDLMVIGAGCSEEILLSGQGGDAGLLRAWAETWGLSTIVSALQILEHTHARMRLSLHRRALTEVALVQIAQLKKVVDLVDLARQIQGSSTATVTPGSLAKKKIADVVPKDDAIIIEDSLKAELTNGPSVQHHAVQIPETKGDAGIGDGVVAEGDATQLWELVIDRLSGISATCAREYKQCTFAVPNRLVVSFEEALPADRCDRPEQRQEIENILQRVSGRRIEVQFEILGQGMPDETPPRATMRERIKRSYQHPLVKEAIHLFDAEITRVVTARE